MHFRTFSFPILYSQVLQLDELCKVALLDRLYVVPVQTEEAEGALESPQGDPGQEGELVVLQGTV